MLFKGTSLQDSFQTLSFGCLGISTRSERKRIKSLVSISRHPNPRFQQDFPPHLPAHGAVSPQTPSLHHSPGFSLGSCRSSVGAHRSCFGSSGPGSAVMGRSPPDSTFGGQEGPPGTPEHPESCFPPSSTTGRVRLGANSSFLSHPLGTLNPHFVCKNA